VTEDLTGRTWVSAELVQYQDGSVVSRTVMEGEGGGVTLFAFAPGEGLSEHTSTRNALVHMLEGRARFTVGGQEMEASGGDMILMPADVPHALQAIGEEGFKMMLCLAKP
jgi:quercetin dioxygenase-like cupin family protein